MDANEFRKRGGEMIDYLVNYIDTISERRVAPIVKPGFLFPLLPSTAPEKGESFETVMNDFEKHIMPGLIHWQHPGFHAYFPANSSYPSVLGEMISAAIGCSTYNWNMCNNEKEIERHVLTCLGKMIHLPEEFLPFSPDCTGGGFMRNSSSDCIFLSILSARKDILKRLQHKHPFVSQPSLLQSLVAYCSTDAHSAVEKAAKIALVNLKILETDEDNRLRGETFAKAVTDDIKVGLIPFYACITIGTTSCCACDPIDEIGPVCEANGIWLNVDAAYGGSALICPEYQYLFKGIEYAATVIVNPVKWMLINCDGAVIWTKHFSKLLDEYNFESDFFHYGTEKTFYQPNKRFRALKLWFVIRNYGVEGLQRFIRYHIRLAKMFENYVRNDERFQLVTSQFALVCFRLKGSNSLNKKFLVAVNRSDKLHVTGCVLRGKYIIRFCVCSRLTTEKDITNAWSIFCELAEQLLES